MRHNGLILGIGILLLAATANAQFHSPSGPVKAAPPGELALEIIAVDNLKVIDEWLSTPPEHAPHIRRVFETTPNHVLHIAFLVSGAAVNAESKLNLSVDVEIRDPLGKLLMEGADFAGSSKKAPAKPGWIMLSNALDFMLEESDPGGRYSVIANLHDRCQREDGNAAVYDQFEKA